MERTVTETSIPGLLVVDMKAITDDRGTVREFFRASDWNDAPFGPWRQVNVTTTRRGAIRGLHGEDVQLRIPAAQRVRRYDSDLIERALAAEKTVETAYARGGLALADLLDARRALKATQDDACDAHADFAEALAALAAAVPEETKE